MALVLITSTVESKINEHKFFVNVWHQIAPPPLVINTLLESKLFPRRKNLREILAHILWRFKISLRSLDFLGFKLRLVRFTPQVFGTLAVVLLTVVVSTNGKPALENEDAIVETVETTTVKHGIRGWLKDLGKKIHEHSANCKHDGVLTWVKKKFGHATTTTTTTTEATDFGYQPENADRNLEDVNNTFDGAEREEDGINNVVEPVETENVDNPISDDGAPMLTEPVDPVIDIRAGF